MHTVDICPNLNLFSINGGTHQTCRVIRPATKQVVDFAIGITAYIPLGDVDFVARVCFQLGEGFLSDVVEVRLGVLVGADHFECRE